MYYFFLIYQFSTNVLLLLSQSVDIGCFSATNPDCKGAKPSCLVSFVSSRIKRNQARMEAKAVTLKSRWGTSCSKKIILLKLACCKEFRCCFCRRFLLQQ